MRETKSKSVYFLFTLWLEGNQLRRRKLSIHNATSLKFELNFRKFRLVLKEAQFFSGLYYTLT